MPVSRAPLGQQVHQELLRRGPNAASQMALSLGQPGLFDRVLAIQDEAPNPNFLHSALCAMSLPVRRPADEFAPIMRQDGQYTLVINPKPRIELVNGQQQFQSLGMPFGSLPRLILIHIMTEAVRAGSREIHLGCNFTDWMRRMGFKSVSYGPRGSATLIRDQMDRLLSCEWMIRWDNTAESGEHEFGISEIKLTNDYRGQDGPKAGFQRDILMTEGFFAHLKEHAVPLNEVAIRQLRDSATGARSLYVARLPAAEGQFKATSLAELGTARRAFRQRRPQYPEISPDDPGRLGKARFSRLPRRARGIRDECRAAPQLAAAAAAEAGSGRLSPGGRNR